MWLGRQNKDESDFDPDLVVVKYGTQDLMDLHVGVD